MHGRVVSVQVEPAKLGEAAELYRDSVVPAAQQQPGFRGAMLLTDSESGNAISVTFWDTEEHLVRGQESGFYQDQIAKFAEYLVRLPDQQGYELSVMSMSDGMTLSDGV